MFGVLDSQGNLISIATVVDSVGVLAGRGQTAVVIPDVIDWHAQKWDSATRTLVPSGNVAIPTYTLDDVRKDIVLIKAKIGA